MVQNEVLRNLIKIDSLMLAGITLKWGIKLSSIILCKLHVSENFDMGLVELIGQLFEVLLDLSH